MVLFNLPIIATSFFSFPTYRSFIFSWQPTPLGSGGSRIASKKSFTFSSSSFSPSSLFFLHLHLIFLVPSFHPCTKLVRGALLCNRTAQFIQDQVRLSPLTRWHAHTFTHINPVVRRVSRKTSVNQYHNQDRVIKQIHITYIGLQQK